MAKWRIQEQVEKELMPGGSLEPVKSTFEIYRDEPPYGYVASFEDEKDAMIAVSAREAVDALENLVMAIKLIGDPCEVEMALRQADAVLDGIAKAKGGA